MTTSDTLPQTTNQELAALRQRVIELEQQLAACRQVHAAFADENMFRQIFERSVDAMLLSNGQQILDCNQAAVAILGCRDRDHILALTSEHLSPPTQPDGRPSGEKAFEMVSRVLEQGSLRFEWTHRRADGELFPAEILLIALPQASGQPLFFSIMHDITERKRIEAARVRLETIIEATPDFVGMADMQGQVTYFNQAARHMLGLEPDADVTQICMTDTHPTWVNDLIMREAMPAVMQQGIWRGQTAFVNPAGQETPVSQVILGHRGPDGALQFLSTMCRDISEQVHTEQALRKFYALVESVPDAVVVSDLQGILTYVNPVFKTMFGYHDESLGMHMRQFYPEDEMTQAAHIVQQIQTHGSWQGKQMRRHKDGNQFISHTSALLVRDNTGEPIGMAAIIRDITAQERDRERLEFTQRSFELITDAAYWIRRDGTIAAINEAACQQLGYTRDEFLAMTVFDLDPAYPLEAWEGFFAYKGSVIIEGQHYTKAGRRLPVEISANYMQYNGEEYSLAFVRDISERKQAEEERSQLQAQVIEAQRAALHELSTPLIPVADGVVVMPLIGSMDSARAQQVMETLLEGVATHRATIALLDITGLPIVDTQVAHALVRAAQAVKLLGAQIILTGIRPEVAQTLVGMGADLSGIVTLNNLQKGIVHALQQQHITAGANGKNGSDVINRR
jgi:rsbT co-antagonist protein RsbR